MVPQCSVMIAVHCLCAIECTHCDLNFPEACSTKQKLKKHKNRAKFILHTLEFQLTFWLSPHKVQHCKTIGTISFPIFGE